MADNRPKPVAPGYAHAGSGPPNGTYAGASSNDPSRTMSASPASTTPNGGAPKPAVRRRPKANPLVQAKKSVIRRRPKPEVPGKAKNAALPPPPPVELDPYYNDPVYKQEPVSFPVYASTKASLDGLRFHAMRLMSKERLDLYDESQFEQPIRLHRRDPRAGPNPNAEAVVEELPEDPEDVKERERLELLKEQRRKQREENQAQIAPSLKPTKQQPFQKKTEQVFRSNDTPEAKKRAAIRYEEAIPWHLEDFNHKEIWTGSYETALSECHIMLIEHEGGFRMVPVEKWYKFNNKVRGKVWSAEEAEAAYSVKIKPAEYQIERQRLDMEREKRLKDQYQGPKMFAGQAERGGTLGGARGGGGMTTRNDDGDAHELDYNLEEDFADDEEGVNGLLEGDEEDLKDLQNKIQGEQLAANVFGLTQEQAVWKDEEEERKRKEAEARLKKRTNKLMRKHEHNYLYEDDSDAENPYSSSVSNICNVTI